MLSVSQGAWACEEPRVSGYYFVDCLSEGLARVKKDGKYGFIDKTGKVVIPLQYDGVESFSEGLAGVKKDGKYGLIDKTGKVIVPLQYDGVYGFSEGLAGVKKDGKYGFIDKTGKVVIPLKYDDLEKGFGKGRIFAEVKRNGHTYYVSRLGDEYTSIGSVSEGLVWVANNGKYGFIDKTGQVVIPLQYDFAWWEFSEGLTYVKKNGKWGFIDKTGKVVIAFQYDSADVFQNGQAEVALDDGKTPKYFYIDKTGKVLTKRSSLAEFRKKLAQGDDVRYKTSNDDGKGMIFEIKGNLVQVQTTEEQCTQRDYRGDCQNYVKNPVAKWVKRSEIYPTNHWN